MEKIQQRLNELGFGPLVVDGIVGPRTTAAVRRFQASKGLVADGIVGPKTLGALGLLTDNVRPSPGATLPNVPWMNIALSKLGLHESSNNDTLRTFLRSDGQTLGDPSQLPWCGDFVETSLKLAIPGLKVPQNPYLARNWAAWGEAAPPQYGSILVFWRGSRNGTNGHIGFYVGENSNSYLVLGGNQSNAVTKSYLGKDRLLASRLPPGWRLDGTRLQAEEGGPLSTNEE